jgi:hypothetical protein
MGDVPVTRSGAEPPHQRLTQTDGKTTAFLGLLMLLANSEMRLQVASAGEKSRF